EVYFDHQFDIVLERHKRIKIFNEKAKDEANIRLKFFAAHNYEDIYDLSAQTINLKDGKPVITKLERKQIFRETIDKNSVAIVFTFPDVQNGSVIEFKYKWKTPSFGNFPTWYFQSNLPARYTQLKTEIPDMLFYKTQYRVHQEYHTHKNSSESRSLGSGTESQGYSVDTKIIGLKNVPSLIDEPYMTSRFDNLQCAIFLLTSIRPLGGFTRTGTDTWGKVGQRLIEDEDFGLQFKKKLEGEDALITKAQQLKSDEEKIAFLFNEVKNSLKWNGVDDWYTNDGVSKAWQKRTGNSTEINLILYRLLKQADVKNVYPMVVSTRENGKANRAFPGLHQFNRTVLHIPIDSTQKYILDATDKYNQYNLIPAELLNSFGVAVDKETKTHNLITIRNRAPSRKSVYIAAEIKPEGKMFGEASLTDYAYHKTYAVKNFKTEGEEKYKEFLTNKSNNLKIKSLKMESADIDSLPLRETISFELDLTSSDGDYIFFVPNLFTGLRQNPFINENRTTLIDFGYNNKYQISGLFKLPAGYKVDVLPKNIQLVMPDKSISFIRQIMETEGNVSVRYILDYKKPVYMVDEYPMLREFYKQIFEMLNEQVVIKKS
ncbi:MAG: DUF3857 domain-containing protein, partial [Sphingobacteriaceae bacterium]